MPFTCDLTEEQTIFYARTQSPVFRSSAFPSVQHFHSLYRSTPGANGYDIVMMNVEQQFVEAKGNLVLHFEEGVDMMASGNFMLRSRFTRLGLELHQITPEGHFWITNHSNLPVSVKKRMIQYVPLRNFNGKVCNTMGIIHQSCSTKLQEQYTKREDATFGTIVTNTAAKRKPKC